MQQKSNQNVGIQTWLWLRWFLIGFVVGIFIGPLTWQFIALVVSVVMLLVWMHVIPRSVLFVLFVASGIGFLRYQLIIPAFPDTHISHVDNEYVVFAGTVITQPDQRLDRVKLTIEIQQPYEGTILVTTGLWPKYQYGDTVEVNCRARKPEAFNGFAYDRYLARFGIYSTCSFAKIHLLSSPHNFHLGVIKQHLLDVVYQSMHEPRASLLTALTLGERQQIPQELRTEFSESGLSHIIAISGLHIVLLISVMQSCCIALGMWRKQAFWFVTVLLCVYLALIGFPSSAVRAGIMGWLLLLAQQLGRTPNPTTAVLLAASGMLWLNPSVLRDDIGFQLSFAAVLGIGYFSPRFEQLLQWIPEQFELRSMMQMTLAAQLTTLPLIIWYFGVISFTGIIANVFVLPLLPYVMIAGLCAIGVTAFLSVFGSIAFLPVWILLGYIQWVANVFSGVAWYA